MLELEDYISDVDLLMSKKLYASALWQCRLLVDVVLYKMIALVANDKKQRKRLWEEFNQTVRLDLKFSKAYSLINKDYNKKKVNNLLSRLVQNSRKLERGQLPSSLWKQEATKNVTNLKELIKYCSESMA